MTNLTQHDLTTQLYLKFFLITQQEVKRQKGRMTQQRTANQCHQPKESCRLVNPILVILHTVKFAEVKHTAATGVYDKAIRKLL